MQGQLSIVLCTRTARYFSTFRHRKAISGLRSWHNIYLVLIAQGATATRVGVLLEITGASFRWRKKRAKVGEHGEDSGTAVTYHIKRAALWRIHEIFMDEILVKFSSQ